MGLLEDFQGKGIDILISFSTMVLGLGLGIIIDTLRNARGGPIISAVSHTGPVVTVNNIINKKEAYKKENRDKTGDKNNGVDVQFFWAVAIASLLSAAIGYLFFRKQILNGAAYSTLLTLSIFIGSAIHSIIKEYYGGSKWIAYTMYTLFFCFFSLFIVDKAFVPDYAPEGFELSQEIMNRYGVRGILNHFSSQDIYWLMFHLFGVFLLLLANLNMIFSNIYFAIMGNHLLKNTPNIPWFARKVELYDNYLWNFFFISLLLILSYYLVNGDAYDWFFHRFPIYTKNFIDLIINGRS